MVLKSFDLLSPKIALFFYGRRRHSSNVGGVLTIIMVFCCILYIFYLLLDVFQRKKSNFQTYKQHLNNPQNFTFSKFSDITHYFQFINTEKNIQVSFDKRLIRIFLVQTYKSYLNNFLNLWDNEHWVYDSCKEYDTKDLPSNVFDEKTNIEDNACLRYYYNNTEKKYYPKEDKKNFKFPYMEYKNDLNDYQPLLNAIIWKCNNISILNELLGPCGGQDEINKYIKENPRVYLNLIEQQTNTDRNSDQIAYFTDKIESNFLTNLEIPINNIILSPLNIELKSGLIYPKTRTINSFMFDGENKEIFFSSNITNILAIFNFYLQKQFYTFKGGYDTVYETLPSIGGIIQFIYYFFFCANFFQNRFVLIQDSKKLVFKIYNAKENKEENDRNINYNRIVSLVRNEDEIKKRINFYSSSSKNGEEWKKGISIPLKNEDKSKNKINLITQSKKMEKLSLNRLTKKAHLEDEIKNCSKKSYRLSEINKKEKKRNNNDENSNDFIYFKDNDTSSKNINDNIRCFNALNQLKRTKTENDQPILTNIHKKKEKKLVWKVDKNNNFLIINKKDIIKKEEEIYNQHKPVEVRSVNSINNKSINSSFVFLKSDINFQDDITSFSLVLKKYLDVRKKMIKTEPLNGKIFDGYITFKSYFYSLFRIGRKKNTIYMLEYFREKLLSEEHFFRTHIFLFLFEKIFDMEEYKKINIVELYKNL